MTRPAGVVDGLLAGRYRLGPRLGVAPSSELWRARDELLGRDVAVQVLRPDLAAQEAVRASVRTLAVRAAGIQHPGVAAVLDADGGAGAWIVVALTDGTPLALVLRREGRLSVGRTLAVVEQVAAALQAAHDGGVRLDIAAGTLLLRDDDRVTVTGIGMASAADRTSSTGAPTASSAGDLPALGRVAQQCLSGTAEHDGARLPDDVPPAVVALVRRLLGDGPADRPTAGQVRDQARELRRPLSDAGTQVSPTARRAPPLDLAGRPGQRGAVRATAVALLLLALALGVRGALDERAAAPSERPGSTTSPATTAPTPTAPTLTAPTSTARAGEPVGRGGTG